MQLIDQAGAKMLTRCLDATQPIFTSTTIGGLFFAWSNAALDTVGSPKMKVVPPSISIGSRGWCVSTKVGA